MIISKEFYQKRYAIRAVIGNLETAKTFLERFMGTDPGYTRIEDYTRICDVVMTTARFISNAIGNLDLIFNELHEIEPEPQFFLFDDNGECKDVTEEEYKKALGIRDDETE